MTDPFFSNLLSFGLPISLVLDGAIVDDIEAHLAAYQIAGRPLFRETMDRETVIAGPWLVYPGVDHAALARSVAAAHHAGQGVFWLGDQGEDLLFRHLRKLNAARMPDGRILYFRYYDSDVLGAVAPLLDAKQAAYLFGPSQVICLLGGCGHSATIDKPEGLPAPDAGPITFYDWQIDNLDARQNAITCKKVCALIRQLDSPAAARLDNDELLYQVISREKQARELHLTSAGAMAWWVVLNLETRNAGLRNKYLRSYLLRMSPREANTAFVANAPVLLDHYRRGYAGEVGPSSACDGQ